MRARILRVWEELVGELLDITEREGGVVVNVSGRNYILPAFPKELLNKLSVEAFTVGILRTENGYAIRKLEERQTKAIPKQSCRIGCLKRNLHKTSVFG